MDITDLYQEIILDHSKNPQNFGILDKYTCTAEGNNPLCGDSLTVYVNIENNVISDVSYRARGCAISVASASIMSKIIKGKTIEEACQIKDKDIAKALELPPIKLHCSVLAEDSIKQAINDWQQKQNGE